MEKSNENIPLGQTPVINSDTYEQKHAQLITDNLEPEGLRKILDNPVVSTVEMAGALGGVTPMSRASGNTKWMFIISAAYKASNAYKFFYWLSLVSGIVCVLSLAEVLKSFFGILGLVGLAGGLIGETIIRRRFVASMSRDQIDEVNGNIEKTRIIRTSPSKKATVITFVLVFVLLAILFILVWLPRL